MKRNLLSRVSKLEEARDSSELPNGGIVLAVRADDESDAEARRRTLGTPRIAGLPERLKRRLRVVVIEREDAGCL